MQSRIFALVCAALPIACNERPLSVDDEAGIETSSSETSSSGSSTSTSTTANSTDDVDESETYPDCGGFSIEPTFIPANLMLVVDASSSMILETWDDDDDPLTAEVSRWSTAHALIEALVAEIGESMNIGLQRFPSADACPAATLDSANCTDADACLLAAEPEVGLGLGQGPAIVATLPAADADAVEIVGGSPVSAGVVAARELLLAQPPENPNIIVLITDGGANCGVGSTLPESFETYDDSLTTVVDETFQSMNIPTFVVGVDVGGATSPGEDSPQQVDAFAALNQVALAGGFPVEMGMEAQKFWDARQPEALAVGLSNILPDDASCVIDLNMVDGGPPPAVLIPYVTMQVDGEDVPYVTDCENEAGWTWIVEGEILSFCGSWCELVENGAVVDGDYPCVGE